MSSEESDSRGKLLAYVAGEKGGDDGFWSDPHLVFARTPEEAARVLWPDAEDHWIALAVSGEETNGRAVERFPEADGDEPKHPGSGPRNVGDALEALRPYGWHYEGDPFCYGCEKHVGKVCPDCRYCSDCVVEFIVDGLGEGLCEACRTKVQCLLACQISRNAFSGARVVLINTVDGLEYIGITPIEYCLHRDQSPLKPDEPAQGERIEGLVVGRLVEVGISDASLAMPDGDVVQVPASSDRIPYMKGKDQKWVTTKKKVVFQ